MNYLLIGIGVLVVLVVVLFITSHNKFVVLRNRVADQKAQIDVQLKRRYDLIPNLLETAKGYAVFEKSTLEAVTSARTKAIQSTGATDEMIANGELTKAVAKIFAVSESYPELKANQNFIQLQNELSNTENKISKSRQFYNDTVLKYNTALQIFPNNMFAGVLGFKLYEFYTVDEAEAVPIKIERMSF